MPLCWLGDQRDLLKPFALGIAAVTMLLSFGLYTGFDSNTHQMQFVEKLPWIETFNIFYHLGVDGFSMPLIILTTISTLLVVVAAWEVIQHRPSQYLAAFLIMEGLMIAVFSALDAVLFYVFFEAMLIPLFLVIGIWGGPNRVYATLKFFLYTFFGSRRYARSTIRCQNHAGSFRWAPAPTAAVTTTSSSSNEMDYSTFISNVKNGGVSNVEIQGREIQGKLTDGSKFITYSPDYDPGLIGDLLDNGVSIQAEPVEKTSLLMQIFIFDLNDGCQVRGELELFESDSIEDFYG